MAVLTVHASIPRWILLSAQTDKYHSLLTSQPDILALSPVLLSSVHPTQNLVAPFIRPFPGLLGWITQLNLLGCVELVSQSVEDKDHRIMQSISLTPKLHHSLAGLALAQVVLRSREVGMCSEPTLAGHITH